MSMRPPNLAQCALYSVMLRNPQLKTKLESSWTWTMDMLECPEGFILPYKPDVVV